MWPSHSHQIAWLSAPGAAAGRAGLRACPSIRNGAVNTGTLPKLGKSSGAKTPRALHCSDSKMSAGSLYFASGTPNAWPFFTTSSIRCVFAHVRRCSFISVPRRPRSSGSHSAGSWVHAGFPRSSTSPSHCGDTVCQIQDVTPRLFNTSAFCYGSLKKIGTSGTERLSDL